MRVLRLLRIGAIGALLSGAVFIASLVYQFIAVSNLGKDNLPDNLPKNTETQIRFVLDFAYHHPRLTTVFTIEAVLAVTSTLLLAGPAIGLYLILRAYRPTAAMLSLGMGLVSLLLNSVSQLMQLYAWQTAPSTYLHATSKTAQHDAVINFEHVYSLVRILDTLGSAGLATWLALLGFHMLRSRATHRYAAWGTIGTAFGSFVGLPLLPLWTVGVGVSLLRLDPTFFEHAGEQEIVAAEAADEVVPERTVRAARPPARGGHGRRRKRR